MLAKVLREWNIKLTKREKATLFTIVDTIFFSSLMVEEGEPVRVAVVHEPQGVRGLAVLTDDYGDLAWHVTAINRIPFDARNLAKLSTGLKYGKQLVVVGGDDKQLRVDGIARRLPWMNGGDSIRIAAPRPGVLVFERKYDELFRLEAGTRAQPRFDVLGKDGPIRSAIAKIAGVSPGSASSYSHIEWGLIRLMQEICAVGAGAILAVCPAEPKPAIRNSIAYRRKDPSLFKKMLDAQHHSSRSYLFKRIGTAGSDLRSDEVAELEHAQAEVKRSGDLLTAGIEDLAHLSAIDGAVLMGPGLTVYGGGCILPKARRALAPLLFRALDTSADKREPYLHKHGARHNAAFSFAYTHPEGLAFVFSEDGPVNCVMRLDNRLVIWSVQVLET